ncbi:cytochrome P450 CYP82J17-like [Syzygium oleosum]|uniref:cytochrome P450 CYP82J17-like n=1 Tax=Syzygium oleosum TaxID=219896 RepID=UPI0011D19906|nr:cytochrome P450 CYP82J17-like [Syzygium oleosum]
MLFLTHLLAVLGVPLLLLILWRATSSPSKPRGTTLPPELPGAWPIIGHLHLLRGETTLARTLAAMADAQGPMFRIRLGVHPTIVISSREVVRECFTAHDKNLASRVKSKAGIHLGCGNAAFAFAEYGDFWREMRKITMLELLSTRRLDNLKHVQASEIDTFIKDLRTLCRTNTDNVQNGSSKVVVISQLLELLTLNIIIRMIASKRYFGLSSASTGSSTDDDEASHLRKVIKDMMYISGFPAISDLLPFAGWTDCVGTVKTMKRVARELDEIIGKWVEEHKLKRGDDQRGGAMDVQEDFIDVMLSVIGEEGFASFGYSPETLVKATVMNIIVAASDTTSLNLTWVLSLLLNNKHVMERAQEEIDLKVGKGKWVQDSDIENLPYLQAIVKETLRLYPPGPVLVPHEARADCTINGYLIPKGTWIFVNAWKLHRDPRVWSDPEKFSPERFLTSHSGVDASGQHFEFIPFGSGRRSCPGASFALRVTHLTLARLLQAFDLATPSDEPVDMTEGLGVNLPKATPLEVVLTPRLPSKLYEQLMQN